MPNHVFPKAAGISLVQDLGGIKIRAIGYLDWAFPMPFIRRSWSINDICCHVNIGWVVSVSNPLPYSLACGDPDMMRLSTQSKGNKWCNSWDISVIAGNMVSEPG